MSPEAEHRDTPVRVLHVGTAPLSQTVMDGLRAIGVEVEVVTPDDIDDVLMPNLHEAELRPITHEARQAVAKRLREADVCVLDEGAGPRLATLILSLRQAEECKNITTIEMISDIATGVGMESSLQGTLGGRGMFDLCDLIDRKDLLARLRSLGTPQVIAAPILSITTAPTRAPRPLPYAQHPGTYTLVDGAARVTDLPVDMRRAGGEMHLQELLAPGAAGRWAETCAHDALISLICHLPIEDLPLLATPEAAWWWGRLFEQLDAVEHPPHYHWLDISQQREELDTILWHALARDGGRDTLAMLPDAFVPAREAATQLWSGEVQDLADRMPGEFASATENTWYNSTGMAVLKQWDVVPCEDPLDPDADPNLYRPTLMTLRVARRYRLAPEVIRDGYTRWGGRPYLETETSRQLTRFVGESYPGSEEELEGWIRVPQTLPAGRLRNLVCEGMNLWPRIEIPLAEVWPHDGGVELNGKRVPIWDRAQKPLGMLFGRRELSEPTRRLMQVLWDQHVITDEHFAGIKAQVRNLIRPGVGP